MSKPLDAQIDALYAVPLTQFVAARTALARTMTGAEAKRVKALAKPTTIPWIVNQLRWHERAVYEQVMKAGAAVRRAQVAALEGRRGAVAEATTAHRRALERAVTAAAPLAAEAGVTMDADAVQRMLDTISLADQLPEPHGRFTDIVQPAGFEALLGIAVQAAPGAGRRTDRPSAPPSPRPSAAAAAPSLAAQRAAARDAETRARAQADAEAKRAAAIRKAEAALTRAKEKETEAREAWHAARDAADAASRALEALKHEPA